jgi:hypothetical protein
MYLLPYLIKDDETDRQTHTHEINKYEKERAERGEEGYTNNNSKQQQQQQQQNMKNNIGVMCLQLLRLSRCLIEMRVAVDIPRSPRPRYPEPWRRRRGGGGS